MRLLIGVSSSTFLARFVEGCLSSGCSSAVCLGMLKYVFCFVNCACCFDCSKR